MTKSKPDQILSFFMFHYLWLPSWGKATFVATRTVSLYIQSFVLNPRFQLLLTPVLCGCHQPSPSCCMCGPSFINLLLNFWCFLMAASLGQPLFHSSCCSHFVSWFPGCLAWLHTAQHRSSGLEILFNIVAFVLNNWTVCRVIQQFGVYIWHINTSSYLSQRRE